MELESEQEAMLHGDKGGAIKKAMATFVQYGEAFKAEKLVPVKSSHLAGTFGIKTFKAYFHVLDLLVKEGVTCKVLTTVDPRP